MRLQEAESRALALDDLLLGVPGLPNIGIRRPVTRY